MQRSLVRRGETTWIPPGRCSGKVGAPRGPLLLSVCSDPSQLPRGSLSVCFRNRGGKGQRSKRDRYFVDPRAAPALDGPAQEAAESNPSPC